MKYLILLLVVAISCTSNESPRTEVVDSTTVKSNSNTDPRLTPNQDSLDLPASSDLNSAILGLWKDGKDANVTFIIKKDRIDYPDIPGSYKYDLKGKTMMIHYDDHIGRFGVQMKGMDTLIMTADGDNQIFYRAKD